MQLTNTEASWIHQLNFALGNKLDELIEARVTPAEADVEMRGFFDQLYIDIYNFELDPRVRETVIGKAQELDAQICRIQLH